MIRIRIKIFHRPWRRGSDYLPPQAVHPLRGKTVAASARARERAPPTRRTASEAVDGRAFWAGSGGRQSAAAYADRADCAGTTRRVSRAIVKPWTMMENTTTT